MWGQRSRLKINGFTPIKAIVVKKKGNRGLPEPEPIIDSRNEATSEDEQNNEDQPSQATMPHGEGTSSASLHEHIDELTMRVDSFWDQHQEFEISVNRQLDEIKAQNKTILTNQKIIQMQLAQLLSYHAAPPPPHNNH